MGEICSATSQQLYPISRSKLCMPSHVGDETYLVTSLSCCQHHAINKPKKGSNDKRLSLFGSDTLRHQNRQEAGTRTL